jgi:RNA polymerase sigma factor (sigma-70 family)
MAKDRLMLPADRLARAAAKLRPLEREVLALSAGQGLTNAQIAARLEITVHAVERVLAEALYKLDRELERQERPWWRLW